MRWFTEMAPIRSKFMVITYMMTALAFLSATTAALGSIYDGLWIGLGASLIIVIMTFVAGLWVRKAVCDPYVNTVVRMEALAAGDLNAPIVYTGYGDCVGRLSRGMLTFRDAAVAQRESAEQQTTVVKVLSSHLAEMSNGDLTGTITADFPGHYASLKENFNEAQAALRALIGAVGESAATIHTGSTEIASASEDLARRTEGNAASLEQTSASLVQIDGRLKATAEASARTVERADQAIATVGGGRSIADEAVQAMGRVSESAKGIDSVIEGLDKIAFQTRVLAMNAAVEAGRAGDAGRGFAVVADLVSALAMRAEEEAKRARDQLTVTQTDIVTAVEAVQKVDGALADISGDVGTVHQLLGTMAADNQAQSSAITQISAAISTMDHSTQQNAAMVEETSAAARNLTNEVSSLTEQAARFKVEQGGARKPASAHTKVSAYVDKPGSKGKSYVSPVKPLPAAAVSALVRSDGDWNQF